MLICSGKFLTRMSICKSVTLRRSYHMPTNFISFMDNYCKSYKNAQSEPALMYSSLKKKLEEYDELKTLAKSSDKELAELASIDLEVVDDSIESMIQDICVDLVPVEKHDDENALLEVVPGAGGQEASLFAEEIFNLYLKFCESEGCRIEVVEVVKNSVSKNSKAVSNTGIIKGVARILGEGDTGQVFRLLKFESGVHRVQRVPVTGTKSDRLQTSTCSVAVLPEPRTVNIIINEKDLKWDFMRASGAGGQGVNTADSAVRLTHVPTNTVVESQEERAQAQNKQRALQKLKSKLYQEEWTREQSKLVSSRKLQIGNMNRNEKIRTYNFHRHMISDHRINQSVTVPSIHQWFSGSLGYNILDDLRKQLEKADNADRLETILSNY